MFICLTLDKVIIIFETAKRFFIFNISLTFTPYYIIYKKESKWLPESTREAPFPPTRKVIKKADMAKHF